MDTIVIVSQYRLLRMKKISTLLMMNQFSEMKMVLNASGCRKMAYGGLEIVMRLQKVIMALLI